MTPVIRVSDQAFARLKRHAEPLVDTPGSVIERLLDFYELENDSHIQQPEPTNYAGQGISGPSELAESTPVFRHSQPNIFLVPAIRDNVRATIDNSVNLDVVEQFLSSSEFETLRSALDGKTSFHCWATTDSKIATFREMQLGDVVLMTEKGTGRFTYVGDIITKFRNENMGNYLWSVVPGKPWELIYVLGNVRRINIDKSKIVSELGYRPNYVVYGLIRVRSSRVNRILTRYQSIEGFLDSFS